MSNVRTILWGFVQALVTVFVCGLAYIVFIQMQGWESCTDGFLDKITLVLLFVTSALVSATLVLGYPSYLLLQQRLKDGYLLLLFTVGWLMLIMLGIIAVIVVL